MLIANFGHLSFSSFPPFLPKPLTLFSTFSLAAGVALSLRIAREKPNSQV